MKWELELELETLNYANCSFIRCLRFGLEMFACIYSSEKRVCPRPAAAPLSERDCVAWHGLCLFYDTETDLRYATGICMGPIMKMSWWGAPPPAPFPPAHKGAEQAQVMMLLLYNVRTLVRHCVKDKWIPLRVRVCAWVGKRGVVSVFIVDLPFYDLCPG